MSCSGGSLESRDIAASARTTLQNHEVELRNLSWPELPDSAEEEVQRGSLSGGDNDAQRCQDMGNQLHLLLDEPNSSRAAWFVHCLSCTLVLLSCACFTVESLPEYSSNADPQYAQLWSSIELGFMIAITIEYLLRMCVRRASMRTFLLDKLNLIDLASTLPYWVSAAADTSTMNLQFLRSIRLARSLRFVRLIRVSSEMRVIVAAVADAFQAMMLLFSFLLVAIFFISSLIWFAERGEWNADLKCFARENESNCSPFQSVPASAYWATATITTVGYGDDTARSPAGRFVSCLAMMVGVLAIAMPVSVLGSRFEARYTEERDKVRNQKLMMATCGAGDGSQNVDSPKGDVLLQRLSQSRESVKELVAEVKLYLQQPLLGPWRDEPEDSPANALSSAESKLIATVCDSMSLNIEQQLGSLIAMIEGTRPS